MGMIWDAHPSTHTGKTIWIEFLSQRTLCSLWSLSLGAVPDSFPLLVCKILLMLLRCCEQFLQLLQGYIIDSNVVIEVSGRTGHGPYSTQEFGCSGNPDNPFRQLGMSRSLDAFCCSRLSNNMIFMTTKKKHLKSNSSLPKMTGHFWFRKYIFPRPMIVGSQFVRFPGSNRSKKTTTAVFAWYLLGFTGFDFDPRLLSCYMFHGGWEYWDHLLKNHILQVFLPYNTTYFWWDV